MGGGTARLELEHANHAVEFIWHAEPSALTIRQDRIETGLSTFSMSSRADITTSVSARWRVPVGNGIGYWTPDPYPHRELAPDWSAPVIVHAFRGAPVGVVYDQSGQNVTAWALSEQVLPVSIQGGVEEETAYFRFFIELELPPGAEVELRLDSRPHGLARTVGEMGWWWRTRVGSQALAIPQAAFLPVYSTWYGFHQELDETELTQEVTLAQSLGMSVVIVDDGWQTSDNGRGYAFTGDWLVDPTKFTDLRRHVAAAAERDAAYMLWVAPSLVGKESSAGKRFAHRLLSSDPTTGMSVVDVRYADVRTYLVDRCVRLVADYGLSGLKIDFVDSWALQVPLLAADGAGLATIDEAVDLFLTTLIDDLRKAKPDVLVEFRQGYVGPRMWRYANVFRAADCPLDRVMNRIRTIDLRLLLADRVIHSDPLMWDQSLSVEAAADHLLNVLFAVPQVSMRLLHLPADHVEMLRYWLAFSAHYSEILYRGSLEVGRPDEAYTQVRSHGEDTTIIATYAPSLVSIGLRDRRELVLVNASGAEHIPYVIASGVTAEVQKIVDCVGAPVPYENDRLAPSGLLSIPRSGAAFLRLTPGGIATPITGSS